MGRGQFCKYPGVWSTGGNMGAIHVYMALQWGANGTQKLPLQHMGLDCGVRQPTRSSFPVNMLVYDSDRRPAASAISTVADLVHDM